MEIIVNNKKAKFDYEILDTEVAGIMLEGSEMKPLRDGKCSISESYIYIDEINNCVIIKNMYIAEDPKSSYSHKENRDRKLLLTKQQIEKWLKKTRSGGITIVPLKGFFNNNNIFKMEIALGKGKKNYDKRNSIRDKNIKREIERKDKNS